MSGRFAGERAVVVGRGGRRRSPRRACSSPRARGFASREPRRADGSVGLDELRAARASTCRPAATIPSHLDDATLVVTSPGVPPLARRSWRWARERGLPLWGELELGARLAGRPVPRRHRDEREDDDDRDDRVVPAGRRARRRGVRQHRPPVPARPRARAMTRWWSRHPRSSWRSRRRSTRGSPCCSNLAPDHLDWHGSFAALRARRRRAIFAHQGSGDDVHVGNRDDAATRRRCPRRRRAPSCWFRARASRGRRRWATSPAGSWRGSARTPPRADRGETGAGAPRGRGRGGRGGARVRCGARRDRARASPAFEPAPHRGEVVAAVDGVRFVDNSKATNVHAALAAIDGVRDAVLIAGGRAKGVDLSPLAHGAPPGSPASSRSARPPPSVAQVFEGRLPVPKAGSIEEAVAEAFALAPARTGPCCWLRPARAGISSPTTRERGDRFAAAARALGEVGARG